METKKSPFIKCYNCEGSGVVVLVNNLAQTEQPGPNGNKRTYPVKCPLCKGSGYKDQGQGQLFPVPQFRRVGK